MLVWLEETEMDYHYREADRFKQRLNFIMPNTPDIMGLLHILGRRERVYLLDGVSEKHTHVVIRPEMDEDFAP